MFYLIPKTNSMEQSHFWTPPAPHPRSESDSQSRENLPLFFLPHQRPPSTPDAIFTMTYDDLLNLLRSGHPTEESNGGRGHRPALTKPSGRGIRSVSVSKLGVLICLTNIPTLGGRASFCLCDDSGVLAVINSSGKRMRVSRVFYDKVWARDRSLTPANRLVSSNYTDPKWPGCPGRNLSPHLPAVWRHLGVA
jgi:hypothetical protein